MWSAFQEFLGPIPAPVFILLFVAGFTLSVIACAPTRLVERALESLARRRASRGQRAQPSPKS